MAVCCASLFVVPVTAQETEPEVSADELDAIMAEMLEADIVACEGDEVCIDQVLADYNQNLDDETDPIGRDESQPTETVSTPAEGDVSEGAGTSTEVTNAANAGDGAVLNSASDADGDSDGTGGTTRPGTRPE